MLLLALACTPDTADTADSGGGSTSVPSVYEAALAEVEQRAEKDLANSAYATGAQVAIYKDGDMIYEGGFGVKHPTEGGLVTPDTLFQVGSDTKKMAALLLLREIEAGRVSLDTTLGEVLPDLGFASQPDTLEAITLHQLMSHTSGLYDYTPWVHDPDDGALEQRAYGRFADDGFAMMPSGIAWDYSNPNFSLTGLVTEELTGEPWGDTLERDLFEPLGMTRSFARQAGAEADGDYATGTGILLPEGFDSFSTLDLFTGEGLVYEEGTVEMADQLDCAFTRPAGLVWSTAGDMARLAAFLMEGNDEVLAAELLGELTSQQVQLYPGLEEQGYGYGLMVLTGFQKGQKWYPAPLWIHGGNTMAMTSGFYIAPESGLAVTILSNGYGDDFSATALKAIVELGDLPDATELPELLDPVDDPSVLDGSWWSESLGALEITWDGETLLAEAPDLADAGIEATEVRAAYDTLYYLVTDVGSLDMGYYIDGDEAYLVNRQFVFRKGASGKGLERPPSLPAELPAVLDLPSASKPLLAR